MKLSQYKQPTWFSILTMHVLYLIDKTCFPKTRLYSGKIIEEPKSHFRKNGQKKLIKSLKLLCGHNRGRKGWKVHDNLGSRGVWNRNRI